MGKSNKINVGLVGTGFIAEGFVNLAKTLDDIEFISVLTRRPVSSLGKAFSDVNVCNNIENFLNHHLDCVVECSGDPIYATEVIDRIFEDDIPVITMDAELQIVSGSWLSQRGVISEAEGDQPGSLAALAEEVRSMGFQPVVYGNIKGFLNNKPTIQDMNLWSKKQGISLDKVTSFTDGTKIQIEQALVANGLNADIIKDGMLGLTADTLEQGVSKMSKYIESIDRQVSDYLLSPKLPAGVFIFAKHDVCQSRFLKYYKMGNGPWYIFLRPFHLCHLEIPKTIRRIVRGNGVLLNNSSIPTIQVYGIAKRDITKGEKIDRATGSFTIRGEAMPIKINKDKVPIGLIANATFKRDIKEGEIISFDDVKIPKSLARTAWEDTLKCL